MASKSTPNSRGTEPLTPEQELGIDDLIAEAEFFFGSDSKKSTSSSKSKSKLKPTDGSSKAKGSGDSSKSKEKPKPSGTDSGKVKPKPAGSTSKAKGSGVSSKSKEKPKTSAADSGKVKPKPSSGTSKAKDALSTSKSKTKPTGMDSGKTKSKPPRVKDFSDFLPRKPQPPPKQPFYLRIADFFRRLPRWVFHIPLLLASALLIWMSFEANMLQLKSAEVTVTDLPYAFRGTRVVYISDLHINSLNSVDKVNALIDEVMQLEPDLLLLGGDYTSSDPLMYLRSTLSSNTASVESDMRELFFENLAQYNPPLGKYAVAGEEDNRLDSYADVCFLETAMAKGGVTLLRNETARIKKDGQTLIIAGVDDWQKGEKELHLWSDLVEARDCVILLCHNPEAVPLLNSYPVSGGFWIDLALCGHTHGGTVSLGSFELFNPTSDRSRFSSGWHKENAAKVLISRGVGNDLIPLRLNAAPEVHLLTLK